MTTTLDKAQVSLAGDREVKVIRRFHAPRALVYKAYTTPALLQKWLLGPPGWTMPVCEMDVRVGGAYRWGWKSDADGKRFGFHGVFQEVEPEAKLVHTEFYDPGDVGGPYPDESEPSIVSVAFTEKDGVTTLTSVMRFASKEARDGALQSGMTDGMEVSYQGLDKLLSEMA